MRVKDMSRRQQKAVFANMGNPSSSSLSISDREKILKREFPQGDYDKDGVKNKDDCKPLDKKKHLLGTLAVGVGASFVGSKLSKATERKKKERTEHAGKRRYGVYWSGERVGSFETKAEAQADIRERIASGKDADDYELVLESYQGSYIRTLKN